MKKTQPLLPLFQSFIKETETGKRLKKNGERITKNSIKNYEYTFQNLSQFSSQKEFTLRICDFSKLTARELETEKKYWKSFYSLFTEFLYRRGCFDNYVGTNIKVIRTLFKYLTSEKNIFLGDIQKSFYVRKQEIDILVLSPEQLKFLIHNKEFEKQLTLPQKRVKDIFVFGCTTGLRFSDIFLLTLKNFHEQENNWYLKIKSQKTKTYSSVKLPQYALEIVLKYKSKSERKPLFEKTDLTNFNEILKRIGEKAGWTNEVEISREKQGKSQKVNYSKNKTRFCDYMSSHMMRRTAITTHLILGMPEHLVRKISGHSSSSSSFSRYVHYAQVYIDNEIDKIHHQLTVA